jgi:DNA-3-methyladenine glycosylase I
MYQIVLSDDGLPRCWWGDGPDIYRAYHDDEWGHPVADDQLLFEKLCLEGFQAGLSWLTILKRREGFRTAFHSFDIDSVAEMTESDVERLLQDTGIIRHRSKIESTINNARRAQEIIADVGSLGALA